MTETECPNAPGPVKMHCYHDENGGFSTCKTPEKCCWCGARQDEPKHGPHAPLRESPHWPKFQEYK